MGAVRSKNSSLAPADTLQLIIERGLRRLQHALMNSIAACLAGSGSLAGKLRYWERYQTETVRPVCASNTIG